MENYLFSRQPIIIKETNNSETRENFTHDVLIPPLNTDIRFGDVLPKHKPTDNKEEHKHGHPHHPGNRSEKSHYKQVTPQGATETYKDPENTVDRTFNYKPHEHDHAAKNHPHDIHTHPHTHENFSWAISTPHDSDLDLVKKSLIHDVSTQHACGSCWVA